MAWTIRVSNKAQKQIEGLDKTTRKQVLNYLARIEKLDNPRQLGKNFKDNTHTYGDTEQVTTEFFAEFRMMK